MVITGLCGEVYTLHRQGVLQMYQHKVCLLLAHQFTAEVLPESILHNSETVQTFYLIHNSHTEEEKSQQKSIRIQTMSFYTLIKQCDWLQQRVCLQIAYGGSGNPYKLLM